MGYPVKPALDLTWTDGSAGKVTDPGSTKKTLGWTLNERPAFQFINWLFYAHWQWMSYLTTLTDQLKAAQQKYTAIIGNDGAGGLLAGCTHQTLAAALADAAVPVGSSILIATNDTIGTTIQVSKNYIAIEFLPGVTYTYSAGSIGIQVSAKGVRIYGGRFLNFPTAISIATGKNTNFITENIFVTCTNEVTDNNPSGSANNLIANNITE